MLKGLRQAKDAVQEIAAAPPPPLVAIDFKVPCLFVCFVC